VIDPQRLLDQVLGQGIGDQARAAGRDFGSRLDAIGGRRGFAGGAVAGGLLGLLLGGRRRGGGLLGYGGAAVLGALALKAYENYQRQQGGGGATTGASGLMPHAQPAADGSPFELALVRAMVGAAKADGHIDATEQQRLFAEVERLGLDAEAKAYVFDLLRHDIDVASLVAAVRTPEQGAELYLAARLAIDADQAAERAYLDTLATRLGLPAELRMSLDHAPEQARA
jgi:uncharacterized membrane protein YebE (DUF533 family)